MTSSQPDFQIRITPRPQRPPELEVYLVTSTAPLFQCRSVLRAFDGPDRPATTEHLRHMQQLEQQLGIKYPEPVSQFFEVAGLQDLEAQIREIIAPPRQDAAARGAHDEMVRILMSQVRDEIDPARTGLYI